MISLLFPQYAFFRQTAVYLESHMPNESASHLIKNAKELLPEAKAGAPQSAFGLKHVMQIMACDVALYRALLESGWSSQAAGQCVTDINWRLLEGLVRLSHRLSRLLSSRPIVRTRLLLGLMFSFIFTRPFERVVHRVEHGLSFDVTSCAFAQYFKAQGVPELTQHAACQLDHGMAEIWGVRLDRRHTIAQGHLLCDFRYRDK